MQTLVDHGLQSLEDAKILDNPEHPLFMWALKWATEYGYGKPVRRIASRNSRSLFGTPAQIAEARERFNRLLGRMPESRHRGGVGVRSPADRL